MSEQRVSIKPEEPKLGGWWWHSCVPTLPEETTMTEFRAMMGEIGLKVLRMDMADDPKVDYNDELCLDGWNPTNPFVAEAGAFLLVLGEDEDGPFSIWGLNDDGHRYCERCGDIYSPLTRTYHPEVCWDCVSVVAHEEDRAA